MTVRSICLSGLLAMAMLAGGCGMTEKPTACITGINVREASMTQATLLVKLDVTNPYAVALPMSDVDYVLTSGGQQFLQGQAELAGSVPAGGTKAIELPITLSYLELVNAVKSARPGSVIPYKADLGLSVNAPIWGKLRLPSSREGELTIPSSPAILGRLRDLAR